MNHAPCVLHSPNAFQLVVAAQASVPDCTIRRFATNLSINFLATTYPLGLFLRECTSDDDYATSHLWNLRHFFDITKDFALSNESRTIHPSLCPFISSFSGFHDQW